MSEPRATADRVVELLCGLLHWSVHDERIDWRSEAYGLVAQGRGVAIDPVPLAEAALQTLAPLHTIVLTGAFHQRAAWSLRRLTGASVWAPVDGEPLDERPDRRYGDGDELDGGLQTRLLVGPASPHAALVATIAGRRVLWCGDLVMRGDRGPFALVPDEHREDPAGLLQSVGLLAEEGCDVLCPAHGAPLISDGGEGLRQALAAER